MVVRAVGKMWDTVGRARAETGVVVFEVILVVEWGVVLWRGI